ncbi:MAG: HAD family hydrolase [Clostridia bacterium]|nr:HAD family hydrolase [Clostridia bacterium]
MKTKYILFDKDGTLLDFEKYWIKILYTATESTLNSLNVDLGIADKIYPAIGVVDGVADISGPYCQGDIALTVDIYYDIISSHGYNIDRNEFNSTLASAFRENYSAGELTGNCEDVRGFLMNLRSSGIKVALVTADDTHSTKECLAQAGIEDCFDRIFVADGGYPGKPDPYIINMVCEEEGIEKDEMLMVGDTVKDMLFAQNGGIRAIAIAKSETNRRILEPYAVAVVDSPDKIIEYM